VALGLGANVGDPTVALRTAVDRLAQWIAPFEVSSLYRSKAHTPRPQPPFLNAVLVGSTGLSPEALLTVAKALEWSAGRRRGERHGPRVLDIDLLVFGDLQRSFPELTLPHAALCHRRFFLEPLAEVAPHLPLPPDGETPREALARLVTSSDHDGWVERMEPPGWHC